MNREEVLNWVEVENLDVETLLEEKFDNAIIGHDCDKIIYDVDKMDDILKLEGMKEEEADDYLEENCFKKYENKVIFMFPYKKELVDTQLWIRDLFRKKKINQ